MAIGDAGAAKGLIIYPATQDRSLGYQNDNQRADDIAATMVRLDKAESNLKTPSVVSNGNAVGGVVTKNGTVVVQAAGVGAKPFKRFLSIDFAAIASSSLGGNNMTISLQVQPGGTGEYSTIRRARTNTSGESFGAHYNYPLAANSTVNFRVFAEMEAGTSSVSTDNSFTYLTVLVPTVS